MVFEFTKIYFKIRLIRFEEKFVEFGFKGLDLKHCIKIEFKWVGFKEKCIEFGFEWLNWELDKNSGK